MAGSSTEDGTTYSAPIATVFIFNLIVGAGALTIPHAFARVGLYWGTACLVWLAFLGYVCATFVLECMACSNAMLLEREAAGNLELRSHQNDDDQEDEEETDQLVACSDGSKRCTSTFHLRRKVEMSEMASLFLGEFGSTCFYLSIIAYLYGDMVIYAVAVPKSLRDYVCPRQVPLPKASAFCVTRSTMPRPHVATNLLYR